MPGIYGTIVISREGSLDYGKRRKRLFGKCHGRITGSRNEEATIERGVMQYGNHHQLELLKSMSMARFFENRRQLVLAPVIRNENG